MRKMLFLWVILPFAAFAQRDEYDVAYWKHKPDSLTQLIQMPPRDYNPDLKFKIDDNSSGPVRVYVISSESLYRQFFYRYTYTDKELRQLKKQTDDWSYKWMVKHHVDLLPKIDFSRDELLLYVACDHCLAYCNREGKIEPCHRNACNARESWFIRKKSK